MNGFTSSRRSVLTAAYALFTSSATASSSEAFIGDGGNSASASIAIAP